MAEKKEKRYVSDNAQLMEEWNWNKNIDLGFIPNEITIGSAKKIWWICDKGHEWQATPNNRRQGKGCPFCAGRQVFIGFNDLLSKEPDVADEWHPTQNGDLLPTQVSFGSNRRVWWQCKTCSNEWQTSVANRVRGTGCPNCAKEVQGLTKINRHIEKYGSFADRFPELIEEWDYLQNDMSPNEVSFQSDRKIWWKCKACTHTWKTSVYHRTVRKSGCPACSNKTTTVNNCLATTHPHILKKWNYGRNGDITPQNVTAGSSKKVWWRCEKGHEWTATVTAIVNGGICPVCYGHQVLAGYNDLATTNPGLASEWHPTKNGDLLPSHFTEGSSRMKIWWLCAYGHEYQARIANRSHGTGCPICNSERKTSFPEQALFYYLSLLTKAENRYLYNGKTEIDIFLPEYNVGIEYDGFYYHQGSEAVKKEKRKDNLLRSKGIRIIRVKEVNELQLFTDSEDVVYCKHDAGYRFLKSVLERLILRVGIVADRSFIDDINIDNSVSNSILYDTLHDCDMPDFVIDWDRDTERQKSYLRIGRILERLNLEDTVDASEDSVFTTKPKVFDAGMYAAMKSSYETIIDEIGDRVLFEIPAARYMDALEIDGRPKLTFVEMTLLSSLYMALRGPAVDKINQPLNTVNQVKRGKPRVKKILDALHSTELQQSLIRAVFDLLLEGIKGEFEVVKGEYMQTYEFVEFIEYFFGKICPLAERVALSLEPRRDKDRNVKECEYAVAEKVGSVVKNYVDGVIRATEVLLECLPEVACVKRLES